MRDKIKNTPKPDPRQPVLFVGLFDEPEPVVPPVPAVVILPVHPSGNVAFVYADHPITFDDNRLIDLTAMWRAAGSQKGKEFKQWRRYEGASFIASLSKAQRVRKTHLIRVVIGPPPRGGTWGHWQIALAYAKSLSPEFHRYVNESFREWAEEKADPDLKAKRAVEGYRDRGWDDQRINRRLSGIVRRNSFTSALGRQGVKDDGFPICTDAINRTVLGGTAKEIKLARGLSPSAVTRDHLESHELAALQFAEALAERAVQAECAHGNAACCAVCEKAGALVGQAIKGMGL